MAVAAASALVYTLAVPNELLAEGSLVLAAVALAGYFAALAAAESCREARRIGMLFGGLSTLLSNYWLMFFGDFSVWTIGGVTLGYTIYHALLGPILRRVWQNPPAWRALALGAVWAAYEYLKSIGFLAYPWGLISYPAARSLILIQHVDITGVWALSFVLAAINALIAEFMLPALRAAPESSPGAAYACAMRQLLWLGLIVTLMAGYGAVRLRTPIEAVDSVRMILVQQNVNAWQRGREEDALRTAQSLTRRALAEAEESSVDLVVWSETSLRRPYPENRAFFRATPHDDPFERFMADLDVPLLTGAPFIADYDQWEVYNAAIMIDPHGELVEFYGKQHLVPFAESIPFWHITAVRRFFQDAVGLYGVWSVAPDYRIFSLPRSAQRNGMPRPLTFGAPICFEDAFAYLARGFVLSGADLLINLTDNSWSATNSAQYQHFVAARFRPVETRRTLVRSTNSGLTGVLDAHGRVIARLPMFEQATLTVDVPVYRQSALTVYTVWGDYLPQLFLVFWIVLVFAQAARDGFLQPARHIRGSANQTSGSIERGRTIE
ncbi:MAG: apolipoprotein N-acyltransferase [Spirochaetaceae bacterium]|nr:MAG: apolipoprotein N-acyltransferase [Spirochaetaceae bacterium]